MATLRTSTLSQVLGHSKVGSSGLSSSPRCRAHLVRGGVANCAPVVFPMGLSQNRLAFAPLGSVSSAFREGDGGRIAGRLAASSVKSRRRTGTPRAASEDVPSFKGFPPMQEKPKFWWRILACVPYLMPLSETWMYAETAYSLHAFIEDYEFCTYPFLILIGSLPSWFLLAYFFGAYLGVVRNNRWPHFLRFHVVTGMLLEIIVQVIGTVNDWVPQAVYWGKFGAHYWLAVTFAFLFIVLDCIRCALNGMYADVPFLSDASYMQIPYE